MNEWVSEWMYTWNHFHNFSHISFFLSALWDCVVERYFLRHPLLSIASHIDEIPSDCNGWFVYGFIPHLQKKKLHKCDFGALLFIHSNVHYKIVWLSVNDPWDWFYLCDDKSLSKWWTYAKNHNKFHIELLIRQISIFEKG